MFHLRAAEPLILLVGLCLIQVAQTQSIIEQRASGKVANGIEDDEVATSLVVNQLAVLRLLSESSSTCSSQEKRVEEIDEKAGQLKDELDIIKETTLEEIQDKKAEVLNEILTELRQQEKGRKTYKKYSVDVTQPEALKACEQLGGRLALPTNKEENQLIRREIGVKHGLRQWYWISGTNKLKEGNWVDSITGEPLRYTNFAKGEPNNKGGNEHCLNMYSWSDTWNDNNCDVKGKGYVCEFVN